MNECECCTKVYAAVAALAYQDDTKVTAALSDLETAAIEEPFSATLRKLTATACLPCPNRERWRGLWSGCSGGVGEKPAHTQPKYCFWRESPL